MAKLFIGLGNPGKKYSMNRHNVGFHTLDKVAKSEDLKWSEKQKLNSLVVELISGDEKIILAKPQTFMNESGTAVQKLMEFYKVSIDDLTVIYDDADIMFGQVKHQRGGGSGGHNGLKSIFAHIEPEFDRLRIGVKNEYRENMDLADFVLKDFSREEQNSLEEQILPEALEHLT